MTTQTDEFGWEDAADTEADDLDEESDREPDGTEVIDLWAWERDGYRRTADTATGGTRGERRWVLAEYWQRGDERDYQAVCPPMPLDELLQAQALAAQVNDPECDHVGPYVKHGDNEADILGLLAEHGLAVDDNGLAQRAS